MSNKYSLKEIKKNGVVPNDANSFFEPFLEILGEHANIIRKAIIAIQERKLYGNLVVKDSRGDEVLSAKFRYGVSKVALLDMPIGQPIVFPLRVRFSKSTINQLVSMGASNERTED